MFKKSTRFRTKQKIFELNWSKIEGVGWVNTIPNQYDAQGRYWYFIWNHLSFLNYIKIYLLLFW